MSNKTYTILKWIAIAGVPALATLVGTLLPVWGIPNSEAIVTTINAIGVFLATALGISAINYNKKDTSEDSDNEVS